MSQSSRTLRFGRFVAEELLDLGWRIEHNLGGCHMANMAEVNLIEALLKAQGSEITVVRLCEKDVAAPCAIEGCALKRGDYVLRDDGLYSELREWLETYHPALIDVYDSRDAVGKKP